MTNNFNNLVKTTNFLFKVEMMNNDKSVIIGVGETGGEIFYYCPTPFVISLLVLFNTVLLSHFICIISNRYKHYIDVQVLKNAIEICDPNDVSSRFVYEQL